MPIRLESHGGDARGINHAAYLVFAGRLQNRLGASHVGAIHLIRIAHPQPIVGGYVKYHIASRHGFLQGRSVAQVANHSIGPQLLNISEVAAGTDQKPKVCAFRGQSASHVTAHESRCTGEEDQHLAIGTWHSATHPTTKAFANC